MVYYTILIIGILIKTAINTDLTVSVAIRMFPSFIWERYLVYLCIRYKYFLIIIELNYSIIQLQ